jgi:hypothetical protein
MDILPKDANQFQISDPCCGIYFLMQGESVVYVGQSVDIGARIRSHENEAVKRFDKVFYLPCSEEALDSKENFFIGLYKPRYNSPSKVNTGIDWDFWHELLNIAYLYLRNRPDDGITIEEMELRLRKINCSFERTAFIRRMKADRRIRWDQADLRFYLKEE